MYIQSIKKSKIEDLQNIITTKGKILYKGLQIILTHLTVELNSHFLIIYVETFGNKYSTVTTVDDYEGIISRVKTVFNYRAVKNLMIDICISSSLGNDKITFANSKFFRKLDIVPNYNLFFSDSILNFHEITTDKQGKYNDIGKKFFSCKLNFYSTVKYKYKFENTSDYTFPISIALLFNKFHGFRIFSNENKLNNLEEKFLSIKKNKKLKEGGLVVSEQKQGVDMMIDCYESISFFDVLQKNIDNFINVITNRIDVNKNVVTLDILLSSIITESIMKLLFLRGHNKSNGILPKKLDEDIMILISKSNGCIRVLEDMNYISNKLVMQLSKEEKYKLINNMIKYIPHIETFKKYQLNILFDALFKPSTFNDDSITISNILNLYVIQTTKQITSNYSLLKSESELETTIFIEQFIKNNMMHKNKSKKATVCKIFYNIYKTTLGYNDDVAISKIIE